MNKKDKEVFEENIDEEILDADFEKVEEDSEEINSENSEDNSEAEDISEKDIIDEETNKETEEKSNETEEMKNQLIRLQADFSNYKKRVEKDREGYIDLGVKKLALDILPVIDNLERALQSIEEHAKDDEIFKGINLIDDQLLEVLSRHNINEIKAEGEKFDPNLHHAVAVVESDDLESDTVVDVLQKGYQIKENVIRPAMVRVSK